MTDYLSLASAYLDVEQSAIVKCRVEGDELVAIVDKGIAGTPKYRIPLSALEKPIAEPVAEPVADYEGIVPGAFDLAGMSYKELQALAKDYGVPANQARDDLIDALEDEE